MLWVTTRVMRDTRNVYLYFRKGQKIKAHALGDIFIKLDIDNI